jgi:acyl-CoA reductase-like NAD-dependent aldehyde dehydrogenase
VTTSTEFSHARLDAVDAQLIIDGKVAAPTGASRRDAVSPVTGERIGSFVLGTPEDVDRAVQSARSAQPAWAALSMFERIEHLQRVVSTIRERRQELAELLTLEQGKVLATEALSEIDEAIGSFEVAMGLAPGLDGRMPPSLDANKRILLYRVPRGVAASIQPWNWPAAQIASAAAPALLTGNTVVSIPAPTTSLIAFEFSRAMVESGLPDGVFNFVSGLGHVVGNALTSHPGVDVVTFTGSPATGDLVARSAAGKPTLLELGGNGPTVVLDDADLDRVVPAVLFSSFYTAGQACTAAERVLVQRGIHDEFVAALEAAIHREVRLGNPFDGSTTMGPLNNAAVVRKVEEHVEDALAAGADLVTGGRLADGFPTGNYWQPTLLRAVEESMRVSREETFGPVVAVQQIADEAEALASMRASEYGLASAIFTQDLERGLRFAEAAPTGQLNVNEHSVWSELHIPFGGGSGKRSGIGRSQGRYAMEDVFTELKTVILNLR